ncbi:hypothetical protein GO491_04530 [Flavobacteriaceae bacterium Ap0902]|nr:hypothetical protein [Flavobacteriaceae bacterium Ap0902]
MYGRKFFIEANAGILSYDKYVYNPNNYDEKESEVGFGLGAAIGYKYVNTSNWVGSLYLGAGKTFGDYEIGYPHLGVNIGKGF